jgi:cell division protein FtsB
MDNIKKTAPITFGPAAYSILKNLPGSLVGIFAEFIDNSIASYIKNKDILEKLNGKNFKLKIRIDKFNDEIIITDNAAGINEKDFQRALQPANRPEDTSGLNEFGLGMKYAAVWLSNEWELHSSAIGENISRQTIFNYEKVINDQLESLPIIEKSKSPNEHGTKVILRYLESKHVSRFPEKRIIDKLSNIYRNYLRPGDTFQSKHKEYDIDIIAFEKHLKWEEFGFLNKQWYKDRQGEFLKNTPVFEWKHEIKEQKIEWLEEVMNIDDSTIYKIPKSLIVSGFVGILPDGHQVHKNGFVITRRGRVIEGYDERIFPASISGRQARAFHFIRIYGELNFQEVDVSFDKSKLSISEEIRDACFMHISNELKKITFSEDSSQSYDLIKQAQFHRANFTREQISEGIKNFHTHHEKTDNYILDQGLNDVGQMNFDENYAKERKEEINSLHQKQIVPREFTKKISIYKDNWMVRLNWINEESQSFLYTIDKKYDDKELFIYLNMANEIVINNVSLKEDVNFMDMILCLGISELKAEQAGAQQPELMRYAFNEYLKILKS